MDEFSPGRSEAVGYDPQTETYRAYHAPDDPQPIYTTLLSAVAAVIGTAPLEMEPLHDALGEKMMDVLLRLPEEANTSLSFRYEGTDVTVRSSGTIVVDPVE